MIRLNLKITLNMENKSHICVSVFIKYFGSFLGNEFDTSKYENSIIELPLKHLSLKNFDTFDFNIMMKYVMESDIYLSDIEFKKRVDIFMIMYEPSNNYGRLIDEVFYRFSRNVFIRTNNLISLIRSSENQKSILLDSLHVFDYITVLLTYIDESPSNFNKVVYPQMHETRFINILGNLCDKYLEIIDETSPYYYEITTTINKLKSLKKCYN